MTRPGYSEFTVQAFIAWILLTFIAARLTRIITDDHWPPSQWFRDAVQSRFGLDSPWFTLFTCPWCIGTYLTAPVFANAWYYLDIPYPLIQYGAACMVVGMIGSRFGDD